MRVGPDGEYESSERLKGSEQEPNWEFVFIYEIYADIQIQITIMMPAIFDISTSDRTLLAMYYGQPH